MPRTIWFLTPDRCLSRVLAILALVAIAALAGLTISSSLSTPESTLLTSLGEASPNALRPEVPPVAIPPSAVKSSVAAEENTSERTRDAYGSLPLGFEANEGQTDRRVKFLARGEGYGLFLTSTGAVLSLNRIAGHQVAGGPGGVDEESKTSLTDDCAVLSMQLVGARPSPRISGIDALPGKTNYFVGNDPSKWRKGIPTYSKVRYRGVYPGIDLVYYGNQRQLEYDFVVAPGRDPLRIKLAFEGTSGMSVDPSGNLVLTTSAGEIRQAKPFAYQEFEGDRREIAVGYRVDTHNVTFEVGEYDKSQPLIIDPVLVYSSFLGGSNLEQGLAVAVDAQGSAYLTGRTSSTDFPLANAFQGVKASSTDAFVVKLNPSGTTFVYSTYLGGNSDETGFAIAVDGVGSAYIAGSTSSDNFPITLGALQSSKDTWRDGFVTKLSPSGSSLAYSTFLGGDNAETVFGLAVGADGRASVAGLTESSRFRTTPFPTPRSGSAAHKSGNGAGTWSPNGSGLTANTVNSFAIDPTNSNNIYAATNIGVFRSVDAGANWGLTGSTAPSSVPLFTNVVVIDPSNPLIIYVATDDGIHKSTNSGTHFVERNDGLAQRTVNALAIDPMTPTTLYAGTVFGLFKSLNGGDTWAEANSGFDFNLPSVSEVIIDPTNSAIVYVGTNDGMFKSTNGGALWSPINSGPLLEFPREITGLTIDPLNPAVLYAAVLSAPNNIVKTTNGGATWVGSSAGLTYIVDGVVFSPFIGALAVDPVTPTTLYAATFGGGIFKSTNGGGNWSQSNTGLTRLEVNAVAVDRNNPTTVFAGTTIGGDAFAARLNPSGSVLEYLVNFGGDGNDTPSGVALDSDGNAYIAGTTTSPNFPLVNAFQSALGSSLGDAFVAKLSSSGTNFVYSTYLGGSSVDTASAIAVRGGSAYVVGHTFSSNFPVINAFKPGLAQNDNNDAFVTKINASGSSLDFSTYLGGNNTDQAFGVAVDSIGGVYITGSTFSSDFPTLAASQPTNMGGGDAFITKLNVAGTLLEYSTYLGGTSSDQGNDIAVDQAGNAYVFGVTSSNNFPTVNPFQAVRNGNNDAFFTKIGPVGPMTSVQFTQGVYPVSENATGVQVVVARTGDTSSGTTVGYTTVDTAGSNNCNVMNGNASSRCDYETTVGTLHFAAGETSKTISIPIVDDAYAEGSENFTVTLSVAAGIALGSPTTITINDNETVNGPNPIDQAGFFVRQHYIDFFNREPDAAGLAFWSDQITSCGTDTACTELRRINVSAAFFISIEFQQTGYLVYRMYKSAYGNLSGAPVPVRLIEFLPDTQEIGRGVVVGQTGWEQALENNKQAFAADFVARARFTTAHPTTLTPAEFVNALFTNAGVTPSPTDRNDAINEFGAASNTADVAARGRALRRVAENSTLFQQETNRAFVLMQYFGYLRRNPNDAPEAGLNFDGYNFWLGKLNQFNGNFVNAEMVKAFILSSEYRQRFGP